MHAPTSNYHYWPAAGVMVNPTSSNTSGTNPASHGNPMPNTASPYAPNPSSSVNTNDFHSKHNGTASVKPSTINGSSPSSKYNRSSTTGGSSRPLWKERPHVGRYSLIRTIGKGNFAKVKLAQHLTTGMQVSFLFFSKHTLSFIYPRKQYITWRIVPCSCVDHGQRFR